MSPELSTHQRIRLLQRAVELGMVAPSELAPDLDPATPTRSESDLTEGFERLRAAGKLPDAFIEAELARRGDGPAGSQVESSPDRRIPEPVPSPELDAFPSLEEGRYIPIQFLGDGGMGRVFKAYDRQLGRVVALKFLKRIEPEILERFLHEGRAQAGIDHPNVANVYTVGKAGETPFLAMRFIDGPTLKAALPELNLEQKLLIARDVAEALHACHRLGIIHRDIKPTNIMLERTEAGGWRSFVMDFGLARELGTEGMTVSGVIVGTPVYCSPEQVQGRLEEVDRRSDVYALGATLYECLTGMPPFSAVGGLVALIQRICTEEPPPLAKRAPNIPRDLEQIVAKAMEKEPARRYASAKALADDLRRFLDGDPVEARRSSLGYRLRKRIQKNRALSAVIIGASVIILALAGLGLTLVWRARAQAQSAQRFGREAERMESLLFKTYSLPLHDVRRERERVALQLDRLRDDLRGQGRWSQAAGHLALGRGLAALGRYEEAMDDLDQAWRASRHKDPDTAQARGLVLARLYQIELEGLRGRQREDRKRELEPQLLRPAREMLTQARGTGERTAYIEAMLAFVDERLEDALNHVQEAERQSPWFFEAWILEAEIHRFQANASIGKGDFSTAQHHLDAAGDALAYARSVGRSAPLVLQAEVQRRMAVLQLRADQGLYRAEDRDWALEAVTEALRADPEDGRVLSFASAIHRRWGSVLMESGRDPSQALAEAVRTAEEGLRHQPGDTPLLNNLGTALRYQADWVSQRGGDPRPLLDRATEALQKALRKPAFPDFLLNNLGNSHLLRGAWELQHGVDPSHALGLAIDCFQKATALRPWVGHASSQATAHLYQATFRFWQGQDPGRDFEVAVGAIDEAMRLNANSFLVHRGKAEIHAARAQFLPEPVARALEDLRVAEIHAQRARILNPALAARMNLEEARMACIRASLSGSPRDAAVARWKLESVQSVVRTHEEALVWGQAIACLPKAPNALVSAVLGKLDRLPTRPWDAEIPLLKGQLLLRAGRRTEALHQMREAEARNGNLRPLIRRWFQEL